MKIRIGTSIILILTLALLTACMNLGTSTSATTRFYLLKSIPNASVASTDKIGTSPISIGVGPVRIPSYLDRPQIVTRVGDHELFVDDFHQWAEPLKTNISRVLREDLAVSTGAEHTFAFPWKQSIAIDFQISLDILQFDGDATGRVILKAVWCVFDPDGQHLLMDRQSTIEQASAGTGAENVVEAMSMALADLSREIAENGRGLTAKQ